MFYLTSVQSSSEAMQTKVKTREKPKIGKSWTHYAGYTQSILHNTVALPALCMCTCSPLQKVIRSIIHWISWRVLISVSSPWLCWWTRDAALSDVDFAVCIRPNLCNPYHSPAQTNALYPFKFSFSISFATQNCSRTSAPTNQQAAYFAHSGCVRISPRRWIPQAIKRLTQLYLGQWSRTWRTVCAYQPHGHAGLMSDT